jgi:hypothetical protein
VPLVTGISICPPRAYAGVTFYAVVFSTSDIAWLVMLPVALRVTTSVISNAVIVIAVKGLVAIMMDRLFWFTRVAVTTITIKSGVHQHKVDANMTVGQIREKFGALFKIPAEAKGYSGTQQISDDQTLPAGSTLEFVKKSGEKG